MLVYVLNCIIFRLFFTLITSFKILTKIIQALFAVGMSPYQSIPERYSNPRGDRAKLIKEINIRKSQTRTLKFQARKIVRQNIPTKNLLEIPLKVPSSISRFLKLPELEKL